MMIFLYALLVLAVLMMVLSALKLMAFLWGVLIEDSEDEVSDANLTHILYHDGLH